MQIFAISFRDVEKNEAVEGLIRKKAAKLEQVCSDLVSFRIAVESPQHHQRSGNPYRVLVMAFLRHQKGRRFTSPRSLR
jgi:hypothetical protein